MENGTICIFAVYKFQVFHKIKNVMKRLLLLLLTAVLGLCSLRATAQETLTVGDGTATNYYVPVYGLYLDYYIRTQIVYPETMLADMAGGTITQLSFYFQTPPDSPTEWTSTLSFGLGISDQSTLPAASFASIPTNVVYTGTLDASGNVLTVTLTTPYLYTGGNLFLEITSQNTGGYSSAYFYGIQSSGASVTGYNNNSVSGIVSAYQRDFLPKTTFGYSAGSISCPSTGTLSVANTTSNNATVSWSASTGGSTYLVQYKPSSVQGWNSSDVVTDNAYDTTYSFSGLLTPSTTYNVRVACLCDGGDTSLFRTATFTTACGATSALPITENFDGFSHTSNDNNVLPNCWDYLNTGTSSSNHPTVYYASNNARSGNYSLRFYTGSGDGYADQYAFLPALDLSSVNIQDLSLGLYMRRQGNNVTFRLVVGVTEGTDISTFVAVDTLTTSSGTYAYREASFASYSGNGNRIALKAFKPATGNNRGNIDDLVLGSDLCATPSGLTTTAADENSVTLQWTEAGSASVWEIEYGPTGFATGSGTTVTAYENPFTVTGLDPATTYAFQVRSDCGGSTSDWSGRITVTTTCVPFTSIPFTEDFNGYTHTSNPSSGNGTNNLPNCWEAVNTGSNYTAYPYVYYSSSNAYSGNYVLRFYTGTGSNYADQYAVLPALDASIPLNTLQVSFMARANSANTPFTLVVGEMSGGASTFVAIDTVTVTGTAYNAYVAYLDPYTGSGNRIALKAPKNPGTNNNRGYVDDVTVEPLSNCRVVSGVHVSNITTTSADVSWTPNGDETSWLVEYRAVGDTVWNAVTTSNNPYTITGLTNAVNYQVHVAADCGSETSGNSANIAFSTELCDSTDRCLYTFNLSGDYDDSWGGSSIIVRQNGITVANLTISGNNYTATHQVALCDGLNTTISFNAGNYSDECSFTVSEPDGSVFFTASNPSSGTLTTFMPSCVVSNCERPESVIVTNIGDVSATVSWISSPSITSWNVEYKPANSSVWTVEPTSSNPHVLTGLNPLTEYDVRVQADCGGELSAYRSTSFTTAACDAADQCPYEFVLTDSYGDGWNGASLEVRQNGVTLASMTVPNEQSSATYQLLLCDTSTISLVWSVGNYDDECSFVVYNSVDSTIYTSGNLSSGVLTTLTVSCSLPDCPKPANLSATGTGSTTATVSWTSFGTVSAWNVEYKPANSSTWTTEPTTSNPHTLYNLTPSTVYDVRVQSDCGSEVSDWREGTFTTSACEAADQCNYLFDLLDSYGDGWNGASLEVRQNNITVTSLTISGSSSSLQVPLCDNADITLVWVSGNYDDECSFLVTDPFNEVIYISGNLTGGTLLTFTAHCTPPTCPKPTGLSVTAATTTSATLGWTPGGSESAWNVEYRPAGSTAWISEPTSNNPHTLTGLTPSTNYEARVQADCGGGDLSEWATTTFATDCEASTLPYTENFDSYAGTTYDQAGPSPTCWTTYSTNTTYGAPHVISGGNYHYSASGNSLIFTCGNAGSDAYAALPEFSQPLNTLHLNFWRAMESTTNGSTLTVGYVTDLNNLATSFVTVVTIPSVSSSNGDTIGVDFTASDIPASGYICFHWNYNTSYYSCCIDNVSVTVAGSGPVTPTDPTVATNAAESITPTSATLKATVTNPDNVTVTAKGFEWKATTGGTYTQIAGSGTGNGFTANLTGLTPNTGYTYKAFITYNGTTVYGSEMTFTTPDQGVEPCDVPTGLTASDVQGESITLTWNADANVSSWNIQYRPEGGQLSTASTTTNSYTISGLTGGTTYQIQVQANCGDGNLSDWSPAINVTTTGIENWLENSVTLFPNPAKEVVNVQCTMNNVQMAGELHLFDVYGKLLQIVPITSEITPINVSGLANGMYFVRVTTEAGSVTKTFVKKG